MTFISPDGTFIARAMSTTVPTMDDREALRLLSICEKNGSQPLGNIPPLESDSANGTLCQIPAELFVQVQDHLPARDRWCLAISCRKMYRTVFFPGDYLMDDIETSDIRQRFTRDRLLRLCPEDDKRLMLGRALCASCARQHPIAHFFPHQLVEPRESRGCILDTRVFACSSPPISWTMAKQSFRRAAGGSFYAQSGSHRYRRRGSEDLSDPDAQRRAYRETLQPAYMQYSQLKRFWRSTPELLLYLEYNLMYDAGHRCGRALGKAETSSMRASMAISNQQICPHVCTGDGVVLKLMEGLDNVDLALFTPPGYLQALPIWRSATGKCTICATSFGIRQQTGVVFFVLWVKRNLGPMSVDHPSHNAQWLLQAVLPADAPTPLCPP